MVLHASQEALVHRGQNKLPLVHLPGLLSIICVKGPLYVILVHALLDHKADPVLDVPVVDISIAIVVQILKQSIENVDSLSQGRNAVL